MPDLFTTGVNIDGATSADSLLGPRSCQGPIGALQVRTEECRAYLF